MRTKSNKILFATLICLTIACLVAFCKKWLAPPPPSADSVVYIENEVKHKDKKVYHIPAAEPDVVLVQPWFSVNDVEYEELARLVNAEGGSEPFDCKTAILSVVFNRKLSTGMDVLSVIHYECNGVPAFSVAKYLNSVTPTEDDYAAVDYVLENGCTIPSWVQYFRAGQHHNWSTKYTPYCIIGNTYFGGFFLEDSA